MLSLVGIQTIIERRVQSVKERIRRSPARFTVTTAVVLLGLFLRARGFLFDRHGMWVDEAAWGSMVMRDPLITLLIRPIGFMSIAKALGTVFGPYETVLRLQAWLAGVGLVLLSPALAGRLFRSPAARLLFVAVLALHPAAIDLAKEFKPYSVSLFGHMLLLHLVLRYLATQRATHLFAALIAALVAGLFAQDMVMAYPSVFLVLGWDTLRNQRHRVPWVIAGALLILLVIFAQYWFIWRNIEPDDASSYWGHKYDVFYVKNRRHSHLAWWFEHYRAIAASPGMRSKWWDTDHFTKDQLKSFAVFDGWIWQTLEALGILSLLAFRRFREAVLLLTPFAIITLMNTTGRWPFGMFRTNLFLVGYASAIAAMVFDWPGAEKVRWLPFVPATALVLLPFLAFDRSWNARKHALCYDTDLPRMLKALTEFEPVPKRGEPKKILALSRRTCDTYDYYSNVQPWTSRRYRKALERTFDVRCFEDNGQLAVELPRLVPPDGHAWLLTDQGGPELRGLKKRLVGSVDFKHRYYAMPHKLEELTLAGR